DLPGRRRLGLGGLDRGVLLVRAWRDAVAILLPTARCPRLRWRCRGWPRVSRRSLDLFGRRQASARRGEPGPARRTPLEIGAGQTDGSFQLLDPGEQVGDRRIALLQTGTQMFDGGVPLLEGLSQLAGRIRLLFGFPASEQRGVLRRSAFGGGRRLRQPRLTCRKRLLGRTEVGIVGPSNLGRCEHETGAEEREARCSRWPGMLPVHGFLPTSDFPQSIRLRSPKRHRSLASRPRDGSGPPRLKLLRLPSAGPPGPPGCDWPR